MSSSGEHRNCLVFFFFTAALLCQECEGTCSFAAGPVQRPFITFRFRYNPSVYRAVSDTKKLQ